MNFIPVGMDNSMIAQVFFTGGSQLEAKKNINQLQKVLKPKN